MKLIKGGSIIMRVADACPALARQLPNQPIENIEAVFNEHGAPAIAYWTYPDMPPEKIETYASDLDGTVELLSAKLATLTRHDAGAFVSQATMKDLIHAALKPDPEKVLAELKLKRGEDREAYVLAHLPTGTKFDDLTLAAGISLTTFLDWRNGGGTAKTRLKVISGLQELNGGGDFSDCPK